MLFGEGNSPAIGLLLELNLRHVFDHGADFGVFVDQVEAACIQGGEAIDATLGPAKICKHLRRLLLHLHPRAEHVRHHKQVNSILLLDNIVLVSPDFVPISDCIFLPHPLRRINFIHPINRILIRDQLP